MLNLSPGSKYRITYQIPGVHRKPREAVLRYMDRDGDRVIFDGRPAVGTTTIDAECIKSAEFVTFDTDCYTDRKPGSH